MTGPILIVDDNEDDVYALRRALRKAGITRSQQAVENGREALNYLSGKSRYADRNEFPLPFIIFVDLKMPLVDGFEVLAWIRSQPELGGIPVVTLTGSDEMKDHERARLLGAHTYLVKPPAPADLQRLIHSVETASVT
jgi:CheY-like chemotaxis protein